MVLKATEFTQRKTNTHHRDQEHALFNNSFPLKAFKYGNKWTAETKKSSRNKNEQK